MTVEEMRAEHIELMKSDGDYKRIRELEDLITAEFQQACPQCDREPMDVLFGIDCEAFDDDGLELFCPRCEHQEIP